MSEPIDKILASERPNNDEGWIEYALSLGWEELPMGYEYVTENAAAELSALRERLTEEKGRNEIFSNCLHRGLKLWQEANPDKDYWISGDANIKWMLDQIAALRERVAGLEDALLISGNLLTDVKHFIEVDVRACGGVGMEYEIGLLDSIDAFQDLHGETVKELGEKYEKSKGE